MRQQKPRTVHLTKDGFEAKTKCDDLIYSLNIEKVPKKKGK